MWIFSISSSLRTEILEYWSAGVMEEDRSFRNTPLFQYSTTPAFLGQPLFCGCTFTMTTLSCAKKKPQAFPPAARQNLFFTSVTAGRLLPQEAQEEAKAQGVTNA
jgi:hypothetical protein